MKRWLNDLNRYQDQKWSQYRPFVDSIVHVMKLGFINAQSNKQLTTVEFPPFRGAGRNVAEHWRHIALQVENQYLLYQTLSRS